jgi:hypothetical protein
MMGEGSFGPRFAVVVLILATIPTAAMAYIDPGNGAYMVQTLLTVVAAGAFYLRHPIRSLKAIARWCWTRKSKVADAEDSNSLGSTSELKSGSNEA